jgi:uncharacterized protein YcfJ
MKKLVLALAVASALGFTAAASAQVYGDTARVISSTPIYDRVSTPRRQCHTEQVSAYEERRSVRTLPEESRTRESGGIGAGTVLGAIVGGVIGHQFGNSCGGRDRGTAAGAIVGGLVGNSVEREADAGYRPASQDVVVERVPVTRDVERCENVADSTERIVGYDVTYEYHGRELRARMPYDPGSEMPVNVEVRPPVARATSIGPRTPNYRGTF